MTGVVGLLWLGLFLWQLWRAAQLVSTNPKRGQAWSKAGWIDAALLAGLLAGLAHGQVDTFWVLADIAAINWMMVGLLASNAQERDSSGGEKLVALKRGHLSEATSFRNDYPKPV